MVSAFEQSLSSMTTRLQQLSSSSELKDCELDRLRKTIDSLKKQGCSLVGHAKSATMNGGQALKLNCSSNFNNITNTDDVDGDEDNNDDDLDDDVEDLDDVDLDLDSSCNHRRGILRQSTNQLINHSNSLTKKDSLIRRHTFNNASFNQCSTSNPKIPLTDTNTTSNIQTSNIFINPNTSANTERILFGILFI